MSEKKMLLPADPVERKGLPITTGVLDYFPLAMAEVARVSKAGNDQHNPGQPLHWDKTKSLDHADCISRHLVDRGSRDADGQRHSAKLAWRALALLETELEEEAGGSDQSGLSMLIEAEKKQAALQDRPIRERTLGDYIRGLQGRPVAQDFKRIDGEGSGSVD